MSVRCAPNAADPAAASRARATGEAGAQPFLDRQCRRCRQPIGDRAGQAHVRRGKARRTACTAFISCHQCHARRGSRHGVPRHRILQPGKPGRIGPAVRQQPVALRHGGVVRRDLTRVAGLQRPHQPVEKAAAAGRGLLEQAGHLRREPHRGDTGGDLSLAARRGAVEAEHAAIEWAVRGTAGADVHLAVRGCEAAGYRPAAGTAATRQIAVARPPQAPARRQQRDRLQQIGLAAAVRSEQHADPRRQAAMSAPGSCGIR